MAIKPIQGGDTKKKASDAFYAQEVDIDGYESTIRPVVNVGNQDFVDIVKTQFKATSAAVNLYTTPSDKDFFLTGAELSFTKDALNNMQSTSIAGTSQTGELFNLCLIVPTLLTQENKFKDIQLTVPIKVKRGSVIQIIGAYAAGTAFELGTIYGFTKDTQQKGGD